MNASVAVAQPRPATGAGDAVFRLDGLGFSVPGRTLVDSLSIEVRTRRVTGLIGHNGSGKSTLIKLLARQLEPSHGSIVFKDRPLAEWPLRELARKLAYLPQTLPPATGLLVRELVGFGRYPWRGALGRFDAEDRRKVEAAMESTDVRQFADQEVETLSGGERQRVWIAMLVAQDAECLLLDEPISALDVAHQVEVLSLVRRLAVDRGLGVVVVLHDINMAARYCDDLVALRGGKLVAHGGPAEIVTPGRLHDIYRVSMGVIAHPETGEPLSYVR